MISFKNARCALLVTFLFIVLSLAPSSFASSPSRGGENRGWRARAHATGVQHDLQATATEEAPPITHYSLPPKKEREAVHLAKTGRRIFLGEFITETVVLLLLLISGWAAKFRDWAERISPRRIIQAAIFWPLLLLTLDAALLPFQIWGHALVRSYGLSVQSWLSWALDWLKGEAVSIVVVAFVGWLVATLIRRSPRRWWLAAWAVSIPLIILGVYAEPFVIEPLFFDFRPLAAAHPALAGKVQQTAARAGVAIPQDKIFEMLASKKVSWVNAYVAGIGNSKRVVFWDTLLARTDDNGALFTFGHELGHYALDHAWQYIGLCAIGLLIGYPLLASISAIVLRRFGERWRIQSAHDWVAIAVLLLIVNVTQVAFMPLQNFTTRRFEHQADVFGLELMHGAVPDAPQAAARIFQVLGEANLEEPSPSRSTVFWFYSHPPIAARINFALHYDPWGAGEKPEFNFAPPAAPASSQAPSH
ncbi:MAG TPA: M48 family metalloprotease [Candidatus Acidoferrum sp.]|nr:M48 family metalloprotease [Candidatus Acidoferrum sp.]